MKPRTWFEADPTRVVTEYRAIQAVYPSFELGIFDDCLVWEGEIADFPAHIEAPPLRILLTYPAGFPVAAIRVTPLSPDLRVEHWGHSWHRWPSGQLCIVEPKRWDIAYTALDVIEKAADWYYNYLAVQHGLAEAMPDVGRVPLRFEEDTT
jgi:hypothetical protein